MQAYKQTNGGVIKYTCDRCTKEYFSKTSCKDHVKMCKSNTKDKNVSKKNVRSDDSIDDITDDDNTDDDNTDDIIDDNIDDNIIDDNIDDNIDDKLFIQVVKAAFGNRRKKLKNSLSNSIFTKIEFEEKEFDFSRRAEELSISEFAELTKIIKNKLHKK